MGRWLAAIAIVLGTIYWGGGTTRAAQGAVLGALGVLFLLAPAQQRLPRGFAWLALAWLGLAAVAFLPAAWFPAPEWRGELLEAGVVLPATLTPQPVLTLEALVWLFAGLAWLGWLTPQVTTRQHAMRLLALGLAGIALVALVAWKRQELVPGWLSPRGFGPFPNRNHTGHVLALGGILALGCAFDATRRKWISAFPWLLGAAVLGAALVVNYSRGGVVLFLGAAALWAALAAWQRRSWKIAILAASALMAGGAFVLLSSHALAARFAGGENSAIGFRALIWRDTLAMIGEAPWCGDGLGNFRGLFPFFREASVIQQAIWHPESDWLWLAVEMSWLGVALAGAIFFVFAREAFPFERGTHRRLRSAALAGAIGAALHALVDVPAHRPGSALLALMLLALARRDVETAPLPRIAWLWRAAGVVLIGASVVWLRGSDELERAVALADARNFPAAHAAADRAIARAPLAWQGYYVRGAVAANEGRVLAAMGDFRRARLLEPHHVNVAIEEANLWLRLVPALALPAWEDALRRAGPEREVELFKSILATAPDAAVRAKLLALTAGRPELRRVWLEKVPREEAERAESQK